MYPISGLFFRLISIEMLIFVFVSSLQLVLKKIEAKMGIFIFHAKNPRHNNYLILFLKKKKNYIILLKKTTT